MRMVMQTWVHTRIRHRPIDCCLRLLLLHIILRGGGGILLLLRVLRLRVLLRGYNLLLSPYHHGCMRLLLLLR